MRAQENEAILATDPQFDNYIAITYEDLGKLESDVLSKCEKWSDVPAVWYVDWPER